LIAVLPGSRRSETSRLLVPFGEAVKALARDHPRLHVVVPTVATVAEEVKESVESWSIPVALVRGEQARYDAFAASDAAMAASGTVSLELTIAAVPHVIAYRVAPTTAWLFRRLRKTRFVNLVNIILDREVIPELLQENCTAERLAAGMDALMTGSNERARQQSAFLEAIRALAGGTEKPSDHAARIVLEVL
jgi:lipid-A-disaccharide synthase